MSDIKEFLRITKEMNCPVCGKKFQEHEIKLIRCEDDGITLFQIVCDNCKKSFAIGIFGLDKNEIKGLVNPKQAQNPINYNDILDFHENLPNIEKQFYKYLKENKLQ